MNIKKRQVLKHAQQLFVEKGIMATSIQDILTKANISKGTFYNYFPSKNECLKAILILGDETTYIRRQELLIGKSKQDRAVLTEQIAVRLQINADHNLLPLIEAIFHSEDVELSLFAKNLHLKEVRWLADRFIEVYGEDARLYAIDCSVLFTGMLQHALFFRKKSIAQKIDLIQLIDYLVRRMDKIFPSLVGQEQPLFNDELFDLMFSQENEETNLKLQLLENLATLQQQIKQDKTSTDCEYIAFLLDEIKVETPRLQLLKAITQSFRAAYKETAYEQIAFTIASEIWLFIQHEERA